MTKEEKQHFMARSGYHRKINQYTAIVHLPSIQSVLLERFKSQTKILSFEEYLYAFVQEGRTQMSSSRKWERSHFVRRVELMKLHSSNKTEKLSKGIEAILNTEDKLVSEVARDLKIEGLDLSLYEQIFMSNVKLGQLKVLKEGHDVREKWTGKPKAKSGRSADSFLRYTVENEELRKRYLNIFNKPIKDFYF